MRRRIQTIQIVLNGSRLNGAPEAPTIRAEFDEVLRVNRLNPLARRNLMQMLHSTRALDSTLSTFLRVRGVTVQQNRRSLGGYLRRLVNPGVQGMGSLTDAERRRYQRNIVDGRNRYMHQAGANPTLNEINQLLSEMHACLLRALTL